jgi:enoyl-CoA hydratase
VDTYDNILLERVGTAGRVARITLNRPEKVNALTLNLFRELKHCLRLLEVDFECRAIVIRGAGRGFCAGYDLTATAADSEPTMPKRRAVDGQRRHLLVEVRSAMQEITDFQLYLWNLSKITIAQIHGPCLAGGCELAMMTDLIVAADDARIGSPALRGVGTARNGHIWPLVIGMRKAKELYYSGDSVNGKEAVECGMINYSWPSEELEARTLGFADRIANMSSDHLAVLKLTMNRFYENMGIYSSLRSATDLDALAQTTAHNYAFNDQFAASGLKQALRWRDDPYREGRNSEEA